MENAFIRDLSFQSKYFRFFYGVGKLTPQMLVRFTQLDYDREMALVAVVDEGGHDRAIGVARYAADPADEGCEFAIVVADVWQHRGLGSRLMTALIEAARDRGLRRMHGPVLAENVAMLALMEKLGFAIQADSEDATLRIVTKELK